MWWPRELQRRYCDPVLTFDSQDEALFDGHSQRLVGDAACKLSAGVLERCLEVEESRHRVGLVVVVFVAGQQDVLEFLGERSADPLAGQRWVLHVPNYLHIQRVVLLCLTDHLLLLALLQYQIGSNIDGDAWTLWGAERVKLNKNINISKWFL